MAGKRGMGIFNGLPAYLGGKRRLLKDIFRFVPPPSEAPVFADAFLGAGSVSLFSKMRGHRVLCNDVAERSYLVGKAIIENDRRKLRWEDALLLFEEPAKPAEPFVEKNFVPGVFMLRQAQWLDRAAARLSEIEAREGKTQRWWLLKYLTLAYIMRTAPFGTFSAKTTMSAFNAGDIERANMYAVLKRNTDWGKWVASPAYAARRLVDEVNQTIIPGAAGSCEAYREDVVDFLRHIRADVAYFDPPYSGTSDYESTYYPLDCVLAGKKLEKRPSRFSKDTNLKFLGEVFAAADHIPWWVVSYCNAEVELEELSSLVSRHRVVEARRIKFVHRPANAMEEDKENRREFVVVGRPK